MILPQRILDGVRKKFTGEAFSPEEKEIVTKFLELQEGRSVGRIKRDLMTEVRRTAAKKTGMTDEEIFDILAQEGEADILGEYWVADKEGNSFAWTRGEEDALIQALKKGDVQLLTPEVDRKLLGLK